MTKTHPYEQANVVFKTYFTRINKHPREGVHMAALRPTQSDYNRAAMTCNWIGGTLRRVCSMASHESTQPVLIHNRSPHWVMVLLWSITNNTTLRPSAQHVPSWHYSDMWIFNNLPKLTGGILASWGEKIDFAVPCNRRHRLQERRRGEHSVIPKDDLWTQCSGDTLQFDDEGIIKS